MNCNIPRLEERQFCFPADFAPLFSLNEEEYCAVSCLPARPVFFSIYYLSDDLFHG